MHILKNILLAFARHKYLTTILIFIAIIGYLDSNSLYDRYNLYQEEKALQKEIDTYRAQYDRDTKLYMELQSDPEAVVRVAREKFYMKNDNEDVYIFENETAQ